MSYGVTDDSIANPVGRLRMKFAIGLLASAFVGIVWCGGAAAAEATSNAEQAFAEGGRRFASGDHVRALEQFQLARRAGMQGPAVLYNIGVCQYRTGNYAQSEETFRRIADRYPAMSSVAAYNIGLSLVRQDRNAEAQLAFLQASRGDDAKVAELADEMLQRITAGRLAQPPDKRMREWLAFLDVGLGYDDNVALLEEASIATGQSTDSAFTQFFGQLSGPHKPESGFRFDASAYLVRYPDASQFDQNALRLGAVWRWFRRDWRFDAGPHYSYSSLDGDGFEQRFGATLVMNRSLSSQSSLVVRLAHEEVRDLESRFDFVVGSRQLIGMSFYRHTGQDRFMLGYEFTVDDRAGASVSPTRHKLRAGYRHRFGSRWFVDADLSYRASRYDDLSEPRDEDLGEAALTVARELPSDWQLTGQYRFSNNDSNIDGFSYDRNRLSVGLNRVF